LKSFSKRRKREILRSQVVKVSKVVTNNFMNLLTNYLETKDEDNKPKAS
jgi:hypothetical protein